MTHYAHIRLWRYMHTFVRVFLTRTYVQAHPPYRTTAIHTATHCNTLQVTLQRTSVLSILLPHACVGMGWLRLVGSLKLYVSFAKEPYKRDYILQKRPIILRRHAYFGIVAPQPVVIVAIHIIFMVATQLSPTLLHSKRDFCCTVSPFCLVPASFRVFVDVSGCLASCCLVSLVLSLALALSLSLSISLSFSFRSRDLVRCLSYALSLTHPAFLLVQSRSLERTHTKFTYSSYRFWRHRTTHTATHTATHIATLTATRTATHTPSTPTLSGTHTPCVCVLTACALALPLAHALSLAPALSLSPSPSCPHCLSLSQSRALSLPKRPEA